MKMFRSLSPVMLAVLLTGCTSLGGLAGRQVESGAAATVHPRATTAALDTFARGGNAVDAAVSAALMLNVVNGYNSGIGGGCFILIRTADGQLIAIDGRETAPAAATRDMFVRDGKAVSDLSLVGPLASGVPGALAAYDMAVSQFGRLPMRGALRRAADVAEQGFIVDRGYAGRLAASADRLRRFEASRAALLKPDGSLYVGGDLLKQPDLARTLRAIARDGTHWFYRGPFAQACAKWMAEHGGVMTERDLADYRPLRREPVVTTFHDYTVVGFPPPSSGGVHVAQILNMVERFDLKTLDPAARTHVMVETMKRAFADRAHWLGDADFAKVPRGLIDKGYAKQLAAQIDVDRATKVEGHGTPPGAAADLFGKRHTTHIATADSAGNWVAITATINTSFGSKVVVPGTGVVMNNEMDDFAAQPGVANTFGLLGAEANAVAPGKRPLSSMSPTIVLKDGQPVLTCGAAGGPTIITQVARLLVDHLELGVPLKQAVATPRFHHQWSPDIVRHGRTLDPQVVEGLRARGSRVQVSTYAGVSQAIGLDGDGGFVPVHDPRAPGAAGVWRRDDK